MRRLAVISTAAWMLAQARGQRAFAITAHYTSASCDGPPSYAKGEETPRCAAVGCSGLSGDGSTVQDCSSELDYRADIDGLLAARHTFCATSSTTSNARNFYSPKCFVPRVNASSVVTKGTTCAHFSTITARHQYTIFKTTCARQKVGMAVTTLTWRLSIVISAC